jgi:hypothetical protein
LTVTEENGGQELPKARVATRPGASGIAERRRRLYQRHLLLFLAVNVGLVAADLFTSPGLDWAHFLAVPWVLIFLLHTAGLRSRGYSFGELFIPPRDPPVREVYTVTLDYELVRARQLHDGVLTAAAAVRDKDLQLIDSLTDAVDGVLAATESMVAAVRSAKTHKDERAQKAVPEAQAALEELDRLHHELIRAGVTEGSLEGISVDALQERTAALRKLSE